MGTRIVHVGPRALAPSFRVTQYSSEEDSNGMTCSGRMVVGGYAFALVLYCAQAVPPFLLPDCVRAVARGDYTYPDEIVSRIVALHADTRSNEFRVDTFAVDPGADLRRAHSSIYSYALKRHSLAMPRISGRPGAVPAACMELPHLADFAALWRASVPKYGGLARVEASVAAIDTAASLDLDALELHEWRLGSLTLYAHLTGAGLWEPMLLRDPLQRVSYTIIDYNASCSALDTEERERLFDIRHTTQLECKPLG
jgi:hypothetical protein